MNTIIEEIRKRIKARKDNVNAAEDTSDTHLLDMLLEAINYVYKQLDGKYGNLSYVVSDKVKYIERVRAEKIEQKKREEFEARERGEVKPEADLEAEIERWWNERYAKLKKDYKFDSTSGHYIDNETIIDLARHFAEWGKGRIENAIRLAWGKVSKDPFNVDSAFEELLSKVK
jgi:hypothetical protein